MKRGTGILILFVIILGNDLFSQELSHQVLVSSAGLASPRNLSLSQTVGETAVEIVKAPEYVLTQGFQQPSILIIPGSKPGGDGVDVYPNPASDRVRVRLYGTGKRDFQIEIIDMTGITVISEVISLTGDYHVEKVIPVEKLTIGLFFIRVTSTDKLINRTFIIEKM